MLFPSFFAGPCMPTHSPGTAGRSIMPGARSYSSTCFRTAKGQQGRFSSPRRTTSGEGEKPERPSLRAPALCPNTEHSVPGLLQPHLLSRPNIRLLSKTTGT
uniref:Uncharacterized protein n=1 Tax=Suricata suricatta TaxID=37032 RepID=A0A673TJF5_SURSU